jgi:ribonuclease D
MSDTATTPATAPKQRPVSKTKAVPDKAAIALLPLFPGLPLTQIHVPEQEAEFAAACDKIMAAGTVGFDTESKPTFVTGDVSSGPHLLQFALADEAYLFQIHYPAAHPYLIKMLSAAQLLKVGFGLQSDHKHILNRLGIKPAGLLDLNRVFSMQGYHKEMGVRAAVAVLYQQRFAKSRKVTTSNWSQHQLSDAQLLYAANDAYAALKVYQALRLSRITFPDAI